jgi:glycosyltransferase involved in cell wall biosynthesis
MVPGERRTEPGADRYCSTSLFLRFDRGTDSDASPVTLNAQLSTLKVKPIRVAFLGKGATRGGSQRELSYMVRYLDKDRFQAMVLLREDGDLLSEFQSSAPTHVYPETRAATPARAPNPFLKLLGRRSKQPSGNPLPGRAEIQRDWALKLVSAFRPDVIVRQYHFPIPQFDCIETLNIPSVQSVLLYGAGFAQMSDDEVRRFIKRSAIFVCPGKKVRDYLHGCWGVPLHRIATNCIGLDLTIRDEQMRYPGRLRRADIGLEEDSVVVATSGSFHYLKGVDIWVETAALLRDRYPAGKLKFMWIGGSEGQRSHSLYGSAVMSLVSEYGLTDDVIFPGDQRYVYPYLDACDIYVQPSRDDAFPHATLEAMAVSKPVVAFPEGVAREPYAQHALVRVDEYSPEALADGVSKLIESPGLRQKLGQVGSQVVETHFNVAESVRRFEEILMKAS